MIGEYLLQLLVVWTLLLTTLAQVAIHAATWWALGEQDKKADPIGYRLRQREGAMAVKSGMRATFEFILVMLVVNDELPGTEPMREAIYVVSAGTAIYAAVRGIQFIVSLRNENWGRPIHPSTTIAAEHHELNREPEGKA